MEHSVRRQGDLKICKVWLSSVAAMEGVREPGMFPMDGLAAVPANPPGVKSMGTGDLT